MKFKSVQSKTTMLEKVGRWEIVIEILKYFFKIVIFTSPCRESRKFHFHCMVNCYHELFFK